MTTENSSGKEPKDEVKPEDNGEKQSYAYPFSQGKLKNNNPSTDDQNPGTTEKSERSFDMQKKDKEKDMSNSSESESAEKKKSGGLGAFLGLGISSKKAKKSPETKNETINEKAHDTVQDSSFTQEENPNFGQGNQQNKRPENDNPPLAASTENSDKADSYEVDFVMMDSDSPSNEEADDGKESVKVVGTFRAVGLEKDNHLAEAPLVEEPEEEHSFKAKEEFFDEKIDETKTQEATIKPEADTALIAETKATDTAWDKKQTKKEARAEKKAQKEEAKKLKVASNKSGFLASRPIKTLPPSMPPSVSTRIFNFMAYMPWLFLTLFIVGATILTLDARALWFSDEVRHASAFTEMLKSGNFFALELNGALYPDKPPLYFWFLYLLYDLIKVNGPLLYFSAAALSSILYLWGSLALGRFVGRLDGRSILAGGIILLTTGYITGLMHYARMDMLFAALILASHVFFFVTWSKKDTKLFSVLAFAFAALACLTKGPLGIVFPLLAGLFFLIWQGRLSRLFKLDILIGLVVGALIIGGWLAGLYSETSFDYIKNEIFGGQIVQRAIDASHHAQSWSYYLVRLPLLILPWLAIIFCLPYERLFSKKNRERIRASRTPEADGISYLWCMTISGILVLSLISTKILIYMLPVLPAMAMLAGRGVLNLMGKRAFLFRFISCFIALVAGLGILLGALALFGTIPMPAFVKAPAWSISFNIGFILTSGILLATGLALWLLMRSSRPEGVLLIFLVSALVSSYPLYKMATPSLDNVMSPKAQGEIIKEHIDDGFHVVTYGLYGGIYTYYAEHNLDKVSSLDEINILMEKEDKLLLAIRNKDLKDWGDKPEALKEINRQWLENNEYILLSAVKASEIEPEIMPEEDEAIIEEVEETSPIADEAGSTQESIKESEEAIEAEPVTPTSGEVKTDTEASEAIKDDSGKDELTGEAEKEAKAETEALDTTESTLLQDNESTPASLEDSAKTEENLPAEEKQTEKELEQSLEEGTDNESEGDKSLDKAEAKPETIVEAQDKANGEEAD